MKLYNLFRRASGHPVQDPEFTPGVSPFTAGPDFEPPIMALDAFDPVPAEGAPCGLCREQVATSIAEDLMDFFAREENSLRTMTGIQAAHLIIDNVAAVLVGYGALRTERMADIVEEGSGVRPSLTECEHDRSHR